MEIERPKVQDCQQAPAQPRGDQSYKQKWNYDDIPDLNRLKTTDPATSSQQKAKRQRKGFAGGVVAEQTTTKRPTRARRQPNEVGLPVVARHWTVYRMRRVYIMVEDYEDDF